MPIVTVNGIELYYEEQGDGPSLVFAHGVGGNHASWYQQVPFFARWYRVITFDDRGFGNSTSDPEGIDRSSFVGDLEALLDALGIDETALVAQSMGGWTMAGFTLRHPGRVRALVMADTLGGITQAGPLADRLAELGRATRDLPQLERVLAPQFPRQNPAKAELYLQLASFNVANRFNLRGSSGSAPSPRTWRNWPFLSSSSSVKRTCSTRRTSFARSMRRFLTRSWLSFPTPVTRSTLSRRMCSIMKSSAFWDPVATVGRAWTERRWARNHRAIVKKQEDQRCSNSSS